MPCFLLSRSFCDEIEGLFAKYWWQKIEGKRGIHWCRWSMGFRDMGKFNIDLLAKQGWRLETNPESLLGKVLKAKYYPNSTFLESHLDNNPSYTWRNIWATKSVLNEGSCWRIGKGDKILINDDAWLQDGLNHKLNHTVSSLRHIHVSYLIDEHG